MIPGLPNPYLLLAVGALIVGAYVKGCSDEHERLEQFKATVAAVGQAQEERTKARIAAQQVLRFEVDSAHQARVDRLRAANTRDLGRLRKQLATSSSVVPPSSPASSSSPPGAVCFERDELARGVQSALAKLLEGTAGVLQRGDLGIEAFRTCAEWAVRQGRQ